MKCYNKHSQIIEASNIAELIKLKAIKPNKGFFTSAGIFVDG